MNARLLEPATNQGPATGRVLAMSAGRMPPAPFVPWTTSALSANTPAMFAKTMVPARLALRAIALVKRVGLESFATPVWKGTTAQIACLVNVRWKASVTAPSSETDLVHAQLAGPAQRAPSAQTVFTGRRVRPVGARLMVSATRLSQETDSVHALLAGLDQLAVSVLLIITAQNAHCVLVPFMVSVVKDWLAMERVRVILDGMGPTAISAPKDTGVHRVHNASVRPKEPAMKHFQGTVRVLVP